MGLILVTMYIYTHIPGCLSLGTTGILGPVILCRWNLSFALQGTQLCIWFLLTGFCDHCPLSCDNQECLQRLSNVSWEAEDSGFMLHSCPHPLGLKLSPAFCLSLSHVSDSLRPQGLQPTRLLCPQNSLGKNTGVGSHSLLQRILPDSGIKPRASPLQAVSLLSVPSGKHRNISIS